MKKSSYLHLLAIMMVAVLSVGITSCSSDDDENNDEYSEIVQKLRSLIITIVALFGLISNVNAQRQEINYLSAGNNICTPVRVKTNLGTFEVYHSETKVFGHISSIEAWDCQNRKIMDLTADRWSYPTSGPYERWFIFNSLYPQSQDNEVNQSSTYNNYQRSDNWDRLYNNVRSRARLYDPAYPNITFQAGMSRVHGEFIRAKACLGGQSGYVLYGGLGRDWLFDAKNPDYMGPDGKKIGWHAGVGMYGGDLNGETATGEFAFLIDYAETPLIENGSINIWLEGTWYFGCEGHLGAFAGLGYSIGNLKAEKLKGNFIYELGLAIRLF